MSEFLLEYYNTITFCVEILAAVTGLVLYNKYKQTAAKYFIWFLVYLSVCDFIGSYVHYIKNDGFLNFLEGTVFIRNFWWSTLYWKIGAILFFSFYYYYYILTYEKFKRIVKYSGYFFLAFSIVYILFNWDDYFVQFFPIISILGAIIVFLCTIFYFFETLESDKILTFYKSINFYISAAIFIWWLIITPLVFYDIYNSHYDWNFIFLKWQIYLFANILMYSTFTFALIWCKPEND
ncbi:MAG: hypothetical protein GW839_07570 [Flavobacteriales bacterium]|nr:hypothetical protein [Flavobacteriia bacterium]NCP06803.1 hypothetical protein [Flavobacteriales bacterium]PIV92625.1 MAG: hypothetical protein COW44_13635 [Flavobacteriaceae bacterium CG17_big_fil_post_rev_8_21_14_2_50_33_15]PIY12950.1 MAG: hypothetical protein COZ17_01905 [Flavobacteriaceae bacterium CG_4_10_14_3_um_filter_33_47]PJB20060.1 MAG: hypothetical protein CO117_02115 [Flavobacteriaceae bacterium CG_4_9_14_3_um_filter_33_16]